MQQATTAGKHPGFGILYPDGVHGIRVVHSFTQGPRKVVNADGSVEYLTPLPVVNELFDGSFAYASGDKVTDRTHLEELPKQMRERALEWFDNKDKVPPTEGEIILKPESLKEPEPAFIKSSDISLDEMDAPRNKSFAKPVPTVDPTVQILEAIAGLGKVVTSLSSKVESQGDEIAKIKSSRLSMGSSRKKQSDTMKEVWKARRQKEAEAKEAENAATSTS